MLGLDAYESSDDDDEEVQKAPFVKVNTWNEAQK